MTPDFTKPQKGWRKCTTSGYTLYLPRGISVHPDAGFRVTVNNKGRYHRSLREAWIDLCDRRPGVPRILGPYKQGVTPKIDTGVIGLAVAICFRKGHTYIQIRVNQSLIKGHRGISVGQCPLAEFNQQWLDRTLCVGAAIRWRYWQLRQEQDLAHPVKPADISSSMIPSKPIKAISVDEVYELVDRKVKEREERHAD